MKRNLISPRNAAWVASAVIFLLYALLSFGNHYFMRTNAFDMGYYNKALYDFSVLRFHDFSYEFKLMDSIFADHFSPSLILIAPFRFVFGSYTALLFQILFLIAGAWGAFVFVSERSPHPWLPLLAFLYSGLMWPVFSSLAFDFHDSVVASMCLPWLIIFFQRKRYGISALILLFILGWKESMGVWMAFVFAGLMLMNLADKKQIRTAALFAFASFLWGVIAIQFIMPHFDSLHVGYRHFNFNVLGESASEVIRHVIAEPRRAFRLLYTSHDADPLWNNAKEEFLRLTAFTGGLLLLLRPAWLLMIIPVILQKVWNDKPPVWGLLWHYGIELVPVMSLGVFSLIAGIKHRLAAYVIGTTLTLAAFGGSVYWMQFRDPTYFFKDIQCLYCPEHYQRSFDIKAVHEAIRMIPEDAALSASNSITPHVSFRKKIDVFPYIKEADYLLLVDSRDTYPISWAQFRIRLLNLLDSPQWELIWKKGEVYVLKRR